MKNLSKTDQSRDTSKIGSGFGKNVSNWVDRKMVLRLCRRTIRLQGRILNLHQKRVDTLQRLKFLTVVIGTKIVRFRGIIRDIIMVSGFQSILLTHVNMQESVLCRIRIGQESSLKDYKKGQDVFVVGSVEGKKDHVPYSTAS